MAKRTTTPAATETTPARPPCECGCGAFPAGKKSRFLPGHDAKLASAHKKAAGEAAPAASVAVNAQDRPRRAARPRKAKESTARAAGSEA